jgi:ribonuclease BN (tRNA processing enzyme)
MRFTVLGSGTTVPDPSRGPAGFLVEARGQRFLIDGGSGTLLRCRAAGVDPRTLDGGIYSHRHPDHCSDLPALLFAMHVARRDRDYPIWAGAGFSDYFQRLSAAYVRSFDLSGDARVRVRELPLDREASADLGTIRLTTRPAQHSAGALHLRFDADDRSVVFSGDTGPSEELIHLARGVDLLVCECASPETPWMEGHLSASQVAEIVDAARPREVWLTHFYPEVDVPAALATVARVGVPVHRAADLDRWGTP